MREVAGTRTLRKRHALSGVMRVIASVSAEVTWQGVVLS
jgi:hypothetical protein